jgi:hypothetical protein
MFCELLLFYDKYLGNTRFVVSYIYYLLILKSCTKQLLTNPFLYYPPFRGCKKTKQLVGGFLEEISESQHCFMVSECCFRYKTAVCDLLSKTVTYFTNRKC